MGEDYPKTLLEFQERFATEAACRDYLVALRWPDGFECPQCGHKKVWQISRDRYQCADCDAQSTVTSGTILHQTRKPLTMWFNLIWQVTSQKYGANALGMQRALGLGSYHTAWEWLHKLRRGMVRPSRDKLSGLVEVDETFIGGEKPGKRGRGAEGKELVLIAIEDKAEMGFGRVRLRHVADASGESLTKFVEDCINVGSQVRTDGWRGYNHLQKRGYMHIVELQNSTVGYKVSLALADRISSLLKRWLLGTYQGAIRPNHLEYYLDEYTFRFNRRSSASRGKLFYRLIQQIMMIDPVKHNNIQGGYILPKSCDLYSEPLEAQIDF
jgi:transposase-like protein